VQKRGKVSNVSGYIAMTDLYIHCNENLVLLGYYAASSGKLMATYMPRLDKARISDPLTPRTMMKDEISSPTYPPYLVY
jgi:hypothetical protein